MKKVIVLFMLFGFFGQSCKKELSHNVKKEDQAQVEIELDGDSSEVVEDVSVVDNNEHSLYSFGGVAGVYFGCTSSFRVSEKTSVDITFGTGLSTHLKWTEAEFENLISPGEKSFGSLGAFSSFPQILADRVEISYTDKKSKRWCSTRITERQTDHGLDTKVEVEQPHGRFTIEDTHKVEIGSEKEGYRIKGRFECYLYEVNGHNKRKIKGKFVGIVSSQG
jgi:hypothetical protein